MNNVETIQPELARAQEQQGTVQEGQPEAPQQAVQAQQVDNRIPYDRFQEVNTVKNQLAQENEALKERMSQLYSAFNQQSKSDDIPQFETTDQLIKYMDQKTQERVQKAFESASQEYIKPLENKLNETYFQNAVESYFSSDPKKAQLRADMDKYTANLPDYEKQAIKQSVLNGNYTRLDEIFYTIMGQRNAQLQQQASQSVLQQTNAAMAASPYKTIRSPQLTGRELIDEGKKTGNFSNVFAAMAHEAGLA